MSGSDPVRANTTSPGPRKARHLMTPGQPRQVRSEPMTLTSVQRWVMSILAGSTIMHLSIGLMALAWAIDERPRQIGLWLIGTAFSFISITAALLIHQHRVLSAWLTLALIVPVAGAIVLFA